MIGRASEVNGNGLCLCSYTWNPIVTKPGLFGYAEVSNLVIKGRSLQGKGATFCVL